MYLSAGEHFGHQSLDVVRHLSQDWGFEYLTASSKEEFEKVYGRFVIPELTDKPMVFEVFTQVEDEDKALVALSSIEAPQQGVLGKVKQEVKKVVGQNRIDAVKTLIKG